MPVTFAQLMRAELRRRGMTQAEAANQIGVKPQEISAWVNGSRWPSPPRVPPVAKWLGMPIDQLDELIDRETHVERRLAEVEERLERHEKALDQVLQALRIEL